MLAPKLNNTCVMVVLGNRITMPAKLQVSMTNENNTSQTCVYCFHKLQRPKQLIQVKGKTTYRNMKGAFHCLNPECPSVRNSRGVSGRDKLSALAIAISGITTLLLHETLSAFSSVTSILSSNTKQQPSVQEAMYWLHTKRDK